MRTLFFTIFASSFFFAACQPARSEPAPRAFIASMGLQGQVSCGAGGQDQWREVSLVAGQMPVQGLRHDQIRSLYGQAIIASASPGFEDPVRSSPHQQGCDQVMRDDWRLVPVPSGKGYESRVEVSVGALQGKVRRLENVRVWPGFKAEWHGNKARLTLSADQGSGPLLAVQAHAHYEPYARQAGPKTLSEAPFQLQPKESKTLQWPRFINEAGEAVLDPTIGDYELSFVYVVNPGASEGGELYLQAKLPPLPSP